jgi:phosphohistidine phosphatase SixA
MRNISYGYIAVLLCLMACSKNTPNSNPLIVNGIADTSFLNFNERLIVAANQPITCRLNKSKAGRIEADSCFVAGDSAGQYRLVISSVANAADSVIKIVVITKHATLFKEMRTRGGYVLSFRHAIATQGTDQVGSTVADWWKSCDPALARQLTAVWGERQADSIGRSLQLIGMPLDTVMSSVFCRCKQTAQFFNLGVPIKTYEALSQVYDEDNRYSNTMNLYASRPLNGKNFVAVTHAGFRRVPSPAPLAALLVGDCAIFKLNAVGAAPTYVKTIKLPEWVALSFP